MKQTVLLAEELQDVERALLATMVTHPGWAIVEKLHTSACQRATEAVIKLDPTEEGYERKLVALQSKARERNEFSLLILGSVRQHVAYAVEQKKQEAEPEKQQSNPILKGYTKQ